MLPIVIGSLETIPKGLIKRREYLVNKRTSGDYSNNNIIKIGHDTEKSPGDLWRLDVTQTPVENYQLTLVRKTLKGIIIIIIIIQRMIRKYND